MYRNKLTKFIFLSIIIIQIIFYPLVSYAQEATERVSEIADGDSPSEFAPSDPNPEVGELATSEDSFELATEPIAESEYYTATQEEINKAEEKSVIFSNSDEKTLEKILYISYALPQASMPVSELANLTGKSEAELNTLAQNNYQDYLDLIEDLRASYDTPDKILNAMISQPTLLMDFLDTSSETEAIEYANTESIAIKKTIQYYMDTKIDRRVIETLNYLTRPKDDPRGGAGHWKIRVSRLKRGYTSEKDQLSKESDAAIAALNEKATAEAENQTVETYKSKSSDEALNNLMSSAGIEAEDTLVQGETLDEDGTKTSVVVVQEESEANISAHYKGQAVDISAIDEIKCTLIEKKRIGSDKKTVQPPTSIKLAWQTTEGYNEDEEAQNSSFNNMLWQLGLDNLGDLLAELNVDYTDMDNLNGAGLSEIAAAIGQGMFSQLLNTGYSGKWGSAMESTLRKIGGVFLADDLSLPRGAFTDANLKTIEDLSEAVGRASVEQNLKLPYGSLKGSNREEIIYNVGKNRLAAELDIPLDAINHLPTSGEDFLYYIGSSIVEHTYDFPKESFYNKENYADLEKVLGGYKIDAVMAFPASVDNHLGIEAGTTALLKADLISVKQFCVSIAKAQFNRTVYAYKNNVNNSGSTDPTARIGNTTTVSGITDADGNVKNYTNLRDEVFGLPEGTLDRFAQGVVEQSMFWEIGIKTLVDKLEDNDINQADLSTWLRAPNATFTVKRVPSTAEGGKAGDAAKDYMLSKTKYASMMGVKEEDVYKIFGTSDPDAATGLFTGMGEKMLKESLRDSTIVEKAKSNLMQNSASLNKAINTYDFYDSRIKKLKNLLPNLKQRISKFTGSFRDGSFNLETGTLDSTEKLLNNISDRIDKMSVEGKDIFTYIQMAGEVLTLVDSFRVSYNTLTKSAKDTSSSAVSQLNAICQDIEQAGQLVMEIATGESQPSFRLETIRVSELTNRFQDVDGLSISGVDLAMVFSGKVSLEEFFVSFASAKIAKELSLPPAALKYAAQALNYVSDKILDSDDADQTNLKNAFFRGLGLAEVEQKAGTTSGKTLDNEDLSKGVTAKEARDKLMKNASMSKAEANKTVAKSFGLQEYDIEKLFANNFAEWEAARSAAETNDASYGLATGTTEAYIKGVAYDNITNYLSYKDSIQRVAATLGISEPAIKVFISMKEGATTEPVLNKIYYLSHNNYAESSNYSDVCSPTPAMPDNTWYYYDADGMHTFASQSIAVEYTKSHTDRLIDWKKELETGVKNTLRKSFKQAITNAIDDDAISRAIEEHYGLSSPSPIEYVADYDLSNFSADLDKFLKGETNDLFKSKSTVSPGVVYLPVKELFSRYTSIRQTDYDIIFTHSARVESDGSRPPTDYLKEIGESIAKDFIANYVANEIGVRFGANALNADDIFNIFSGNAMQTFKKIGASILESETNMPRGSINNILNATNSAQRECALADAGSSFIGDLIGVKNLNLNVLVDGNYSQSQIESALNLPKGSFKGENMSELIADIPPYKFIEAFGIPTDSSITDPLKELVNLIKRNPTSANSNTKPLNLDKSTYKELLDTVLPYVQGLGLGSPTFNESITNQANELFSISAFKFLWNAFIDASSKVVIKFAERNPADAGYVAMLNTITPRLNNIDGFLGVTAGSMLRVFKGDIKPTDYTSLVKSRGKDLIAYDVIRGKLGITAEAMTNESIDKFREAVKSGDFTEILTFSAALFDSAFDKENRFPVAVVQGLITHEVSSKNILLLEMTKQLDDQYGLGVSAVGDDKPYTFSQLYAVYAEDGESGSVCGQLDSATYKECIERYRVAKHESGRDFASYAHDAAAFSGATVIADFIKDQTNLKINIKETDSYGVEHSRTEDRYGIEFTPDRLLGVFKGDMRPFMIIGMAYGMKEVMGDADGNWAIDNTLAIMANDLVEYYYGDPAMNAYAQDRAARSALSTARGGATSIAVNDDSQSSELVPGNTRSVLDASDSTNEQRRRETIDRLYPVDPTIDTNGPFFPTRPSTNVNDYLGGKEPTEANLLLARQYMERDYATYNTALRKYDSEVALVNETKAEALDKYRTRLKEELEYKAMDCALYKLDSRIPAGFAWSMIKGNGFIRTTALLSYLENYLKSDGVEWLGRGTFDAVYSYFRSPDPLVKGNLDALVSSAGGTALFGQIDGFIKEKIPLLGEYIQDGTGAALFAFAKTGNISADIGEVKSLGSLYNGKWVTGKLCQFIDKKLGLPSGFSAQSYNMIKQYSNLNNIKHMYSGASIGTDSISGTSIFTGADANAVQTKYQDALTGLAKENKPLPTREEWLKSQQDKAKYELNTLKASFVTLIITTLFAEQLSAMDESLGLVSGSMSVVVGVLVNWAFGVLGPAGLATALITLVIMNLFGVYKTEMICTADGYQPGKQKELDSSKWDVAGLGEFDAMDEKVKEKEYIKAAQYKARRLALDLLEMPARTGDEEMVPTQIMTGRYEDAAAVSPLVNDTICNKVGADEPSSENVGVCSGWLSRAGIWANPQTTSYTHIGF